jgi:hypothetical protein
VNLTCPPGTGGNVTVIASDQAYLDSIQGQQYRAWLDSILPDVDTIQDEPTSMVGAAAAWASDTDFVQGVADGS